jgi:hypothetical protein
MDADPYAFTTSDLQPTLSDHFRGDFGSGGDFSHQFVGDFYREPDETCRGLTLGLPEMGYDFETFGQDPYSYQFPGAFQGDISFDKKQTYEADASSTDPSEFVEGFEVPLVPDDPYFDLSPTTLHVSLTSGRPRTPAQLGNILIEFLNANVNSSIEKVRPKKFWIRASVFLKSEPHSVGYAMCAVKIRIYKALDDSFAVEFTRRAGDALVFNRVFQQASCYLKKHVKILGNAGDITPPPPFMGMQIQFFPVEHDEPMMLAPILDMAAMVSQPPLQAEAAAALAELLDHGGKLNGDLAASLCTEQVFQAVRYLIRATDVGVLFPLARFLLQLTSSAQADDFFSKDGLLEDILSKTSGMDTLVATEMSQVLSISIPRCAQRLPQEVASSLRKQLSIAAGVATLSEVQTNLLAASRAFV